MVVGGNNTRQKRWKAKGFTLKPLPSDDPEENRTFVRMNQIKIGALVFGLLGLIGQTDPLSLVEIHQDTVLSVLV